MFEYFALIKKIFFSCVYIKVKYYEVFYVDNFFFFFGYNISSEILLSILH